MAADTAKGMEKAGVDIIYALPSLVREEVKEGQSPSYIKAPLPLGKGKGIEGIGLLHAVKTGLL